MERLIAKFTPYEVGKMSALYQSNEQFYRCAHLLDQVTRYNPRVESFTIQLAKVDEKGKFLLDADGKPIQAFMEVTKRVVFACYLASRTAYQDLEAVGRKDIAEAVNRISHGIETTERRVAA